MYLEVYVFNSPYVEKEQVYDEISLPAFPPREVLVREIEMHFPNIKWLDEETGDINNIDFQGHLILGNPNDNKIIYFRIEGGNDPLKVVVNLCANKGWTSYTPENEYFLNPTMDTAGYWQEYKIYRGFIGDVFYKKDGSK